MPTAIFSPRVVIANRRHKDDRDVRIAHHGWFASWKLKASIPYRGLLRFDFLCAAEVHPAVAFVSNQVDPINWYDGSSWTSYYPRYTMAVRRGAREVPVYVDVDVVTSSEYQREQMAFARIKRAYADAGRRLLVLTEKQLNVEPRRTNIKFVLSHAGEGLVSDEDKALVRQVADQTKSFSLNDLVAIGVLTYPRAYSTVLNLVASGELFFPMGRRFDGDTPIGGRW